LTGEFFRALSKTLQLTFADGEKSFKRLIAKPIRRADACLAGGRIIG
jgi:hypothetical protein